MRLDIHTLEVQSFPTTTFELSDGPDTGRGGPQSYCYICQPTDDTVPSCGYRCLEIAP